jgi:hypothetical protein
MTNKRRKIQVDKKHFLSIPGIFFFHIVFKDFISVPIMRGEIFRSKNFTIKIQIETSVEVVVM